MNLEKNTRDPVIDILRAIGLLLVILAHSGIPEPLFSIREFDVTMLVSVSGMTFLLGKSKNTETVPQYIWKRFKRLVLPVWGFLCFYYLFAGLSGHCFVWTDIAKSFALLSSGVSEVWIFRVYFIAALTNPLCQKISEYQKPVLTAMAGAVLLLMNDFGYHQWIQAVSPGVLQDVFRTYIPFTVGYGVVSAEAMTWQKADHTSRWWMVSIFLCLFLCTGVMNGFSLLQESKYPPLAYYLSYGIVCTMLLYQLISIKNSNSTGCMKIIRWLSVHSMAFYLWHVFAIGLLSYDIPGSDDWNWFLYYMALLGITAAATWLQTFLLQKLHERKESAL